MRAVVLVGGFGTRLRPLTDRVPKPMLPIGHRPMIASLVDRLAAGGVTDVTLALGFRPEPFLAAFPEGRVGDVTLQYAVEPAPLDTGGAIRFAADHSGIDETFVVANGDIVTDLEVRSLVDAHRERRARGALATIHLTPVDDPSAYGVVELDDDGRVERFVEKPAPDTTTSNAINAGTYVFEPDVLALIEPGGPVSIERATFPMLVDRGALFAVATSDYWVDTGRPEQYRAANVDLVAGRRPGVRCAPVDDGAYVDPTAVLVDSLVGAGARVGARARIVESVVLPGAVVGEDAVLERSVVMGTVGPRAEVVDAVVGADGTVAADGRLVAARLPEPAA